MTLLSIAAALALLVCLAWAPPAVTFAAAVAWAAAWCRWIDTQPRA